MYSVASFETAYITHENYRSGPSDLTCVSFNYPHIVKKLICNHPYFRAGVSPPRQVRWEVAVEIFSEAPSVPVT